MTGINFAETSGHRRPDEDTLREEVYVSDAFPKKVWTEVGGWGELSLGFVENN